jgi:endonuclease V-like protein UPF0215 family
MNDRHHVAIPRHRRDISTMTRRISNVIGFDDAPFDKHGRGRVLVVGAIYAQSRLVGVVSGKVRRDGTDATRVIARLVSESKFAGQVQAVFLQGIAVAGFNVVDIHGLHAELGVPVIVVARHAPDMAAIHQALETRVRGGARKWRLIEKAGAMEPVAGLYVQRAGISLAQAEELVSYFAINGKIPEPLRTAHLVAGGVGGGHSRGRT